MKKIKNYIHGKQVSISLKDLPVYDPSTGEEISKVVLSESDDFNEVIKSSKKALQEWSSTTPLNRSRIISKYKDLIKLIIK